MIWRKVKLGDILTESKIISENPNPDRRIKVRLKVLGVEKRGLENEVEGATKQYIRKAGQFIYGKQNFHKGAFGIVPQELDGFESSSDLPAFDVDKSCLPEFIFYFFKQGDFYLELAKIASGVATQRINTSQLFELEIALPDLKIQKDLIAEIELLEKNGAKISTELNNQLLLVKKLRQQLLQDALQGKLVKQDPNDELASELLEKINAEKEKLIKEKKLKKEKELPPIGAEKIPFEIPKTWSWCKLGVIALHSEAGVSYRAQELPAKENQIGVIKTSAITSGYFLEDKNKLLPNQQINIDKIRINLDDIIFCRASGSKGLAGKSCLVMNIPKAILILSDKSIRYVFSDNISKKFIQYFNFSTFATEYYQKLGTGKSTSMNNITREQFNNLPIPLPPLQEQYRIVHKIEELFQYCDSLEESINQSASQNEKLLQQVLREALQNH